MITGQGLRHAGMHPAQQPGAYGRMGPGMGPGPGPMPPQPPRPQDQHG